MNNLRFKSIIGNYIPTGALTGFPLEIIDKMIEKQVEQGKAPDVKVFEKDKVNGKELGGFDWPETEEGTSFWHSVIVLKQFDKFFQKYPSENWPRKESKSQLPRVIEVRKSNGDNWFRRVAIAFKHNKAICYDGARTLEEAEYTYNTYCWDYWRELDEEFKPEYVAFDFSEGGIREHLHLIDKIVIHKKDNKAFKINNIWYNEFGNTSFINGFDTTYIFENYVFEDATPVGVKL